MPPQPVPLVPRSSDGVLSAIAIGRISTAHQEDESIDASHEYVRTYLDNVYEGPMHLELLGEQISGMIADRATIRRAEELMDAGQVDLVIAEDLGRIYRNPRFQYDFVQDAVDRGVRVICIADNLDTADENWEVMLSTAAVRHGMQVPTTRRQVRRTATYSFHNGGMVQKCRYGFRKLTKEEAQSGQFGPPKLRIAKLPECTPVIWEMKNRFLQGDRYIDIADWLNGEGIEPGHYVKSKRWDGGLVADLLADPILGGVRTFRAMIYHPVFRTGKHKREKNSEPETETYPELAHLTPEEDAELKAEIARRSAEHRWRFGSDHPRHNVPRNRSIWPGQAATCVACGDMMYRFGDDLLKCQNALKHDDEGCWNHVQVPCELTRQKVVNEFLLGEIDSTPGAREALVDMACEELELVRRRRAQLGGDHDLQIGSLEKQSANLAKAIATGGQLDALVRELQGVEVALERARTRRAESVAVREGSLAFLSREEVMSQVDEVLMYLAGHSYEFADLLRQIFPSFVIQPVQTLDSGLVRPRAHLTFCPDVLVNPRGNNGGHTSELPCQEVIIDLFEPSKMIGDVPKVMPLMRENPNIGPTAIANALEIGIMRAKRARDYVHLMDAQGLTEPYRELHERPERASRWQPRQPR